MSGAPDFRRQALDGLDCSGQKLHGGQFGLASLRGAIFRGADISGADFSGCDLTGADFSKALALGANFKGAVLRQAAIHGGNFSDAVFAGADLSDAQLHHCDLRRADFTGAVLLRATITEPTVEGALFAGATLPDGRIVERAEPNQLEALRRALPTLMRQIEAARARYRGKREDTTRADLNAAWNAIFEHPGYSQLPLALRMQSRVDAANPFLAACMEATSLDDLQAALAHYSAVLAEPGLDPERRLRELRGLRIALLALTERSWPPPLLHAILRWQGAALALGAANDETTAQALYETGNRLRIGVYAQTQQPEVLQAAVDCHRQALTFLPADHRDRCEYHDTLAIDLMQRYEAHADSADLDAAIVAWRDAMAAAALQGDIEPAHIADFATNLGSACVNRYGIGRQPADLDEAIGHLKHGLHTAPSDWPNRDVLVSKLATAASLRYIAANDDSQLDVALQLVEPEADALVAVGRLVGEGGRELAELVAELLHRRHERDRLSDDARAAVAWTELALDAQADASPLQRSRILVMLARRLRLLFRIHGEQAWIERAIEHTQQALALRQLDATEEARLTAGLGSDLLLRAGFAPDAAAMERDRNAGIEHLRRAAAMAEPSPRWLVNLAAALQGRFQAHADPADLKATMDAWREVLRRLPEDPQDVLVVFQNMLTALPAELSELLVSDYPALQSLIEYLRSRVHQESADLEQLNLSRTVLASVLAEMSSARDQGGKLLEEAISLAEAVLVSGQSLGPEQDTALLDLLCRCYSTLPSGIRSENLEKAIEFGQAALRAVTREGLPAFWAACQTNLAGAYAERVRGERAENLELSLNHLRSALEVRTRTRHPVQWSMLHNALGVGHMQRVEGWHGDNIERAIEHFSQALEVRTRDALPGKWADTLSHLANALRERQFGAREDNLRHALQLYEDAMTVRTRADYPRAWTVCQNNLGCIHLEFGDGDAAANARRAEACFDAALEVATQENDPWLWATLQHNAAQAALEAGATDRALDRLRLALEGFADAPSDCAVTMRRLGRVLFEQGRWQDTQFAFGAATAASQRIFHQAYTDTGRRAEAAKSSSSHAMECWCLLQLGRPSDALKQLEAGKARLLTQALALHQQSLTLLPQAERTALADAFAAVRALEDQMQSATELPGVDDSRQLAEELRGARQALDAAVDAARRYDPGLLPDGLSAAQILARVPPGTALVAPVITSRGCAVFVVPSGATEVEASHLLWLEELTLDVVGGELIGRATDTAGWLGAYFHAAADPQAWLAAVEGVGARLWRRLMGPLAQRLTGIGAHRVLVLPHAGLGLLPLHAAWRYVQGERRCFGDDFVVSYAPAAALLRERRPAPLSPDAPPRLLAIADAASDLVFAAAECAAVARLFDDVAPAEALRGPEAVRASHVHFACHGRHDWRDVLRSGLQISADEVLTLARIRNRVQLMGTELVVLSACETGLTDVAQEPDAYIGMASAFLAAGAATVVASLWPVTDLSTMLLMERFYVLLRGGPLDAATALSSAQRWLRELSAATLQARFADEEEEAASGRSNLPLPVASAAFARFASLDPALRPFAHPFHWAGFTCTGVGVGVGIGIRSADR